MNLARGFKRLFLVASAVYWLVAIANAITAYSDVLEDARSYPERFCAPEAAEASDVVAAADAAAGMAPAADPMTLTPEQQRALINARARLAADFSRCMSNPNLARDSALRAVGKALGLAALAYSVIAGALAALWWIISGFRSDRQKDRA